MPKKNNHYTTNAARKHGWRSGFEEKVARELEIQGIDYEYETDACRFFYETPVKNGFCGVCGAWDAYQERTYTCDFRIYKPGRDIYIETKGRFTSSDRAKMEAVIKQNPDYDIRILFEADRQATPKRTYLEWCEWKGIKAAVIPVKPTKTREGSYIPEEWMKEILGV